MKITPVEILSRINLFENISPKNLTALGDICIPRHLKKKELLFHEGEKGSAVYILVTGNVQLYKMGPDGREIVIRVIKPGEMFAEVILFEENRYPVTAIALKNSMAYMVSKHQFLCLLKNDFFTQDFYGNLMKKLRYLAQKIQYLSSHDVEERLTFFLEEQYGRLQKIIPSLSKKDIALAIGTTPETLSRLLLRLRKEKKLVWDAKTIQCSPAFWQAREEKE